jgi:hypothetical protein
MEMNWHLPAFQVGEICSKIVPLDNPALERGILMYMKINGKLTALFLSAALVCMPALGFSQESTPSKDGAVKKDLKAAGHDTKDAAKDTGHAVKKGTTKAYDATKRGTVKTYDASKKGTEKVADKTATGTKKVTHATVNGTKKVFTKTKDTTKGAVKGAKEGAKKPDGSQPE